MPGPTTDQLAGLLQPPGPEEQAEPTRRWYQEGDHALGIPPFAVTTATTAQQAAVDQQPGADEQVDRTVRWFAVERDPVLGRPPLPSAPMHPDFGWDASQDRNLSIRWYQEPDASLGIPPFAVTTATVAQQPRQGEDIALWQAWARPPDESPEAPFQPPAGGPTAAQLAGLWQEQQPQNLTLSWTAAFDLQADGLVPLDQLAGWQSDNDPQLDLTSRWLHPADAAEGFTPFDLLAWRSVEDPQLDLSIRWIHPADDVTPLLPPAPTLPSAALWADGSGQQDRSLQPVWWSPADTFEGLPPPVVGGLAPIGQGIAPGVGIASTSGPMGLAASAAFPFGNAAGSAPTGRLDISAPTGSASGSRPSGRAND